MTERYTRLKTLTQEIKQRMDAKDFRRGDCAATSRATERSRDKGIRRQPPRSSLR